MAPPTPTSIFVAATPMPPTAVPPSVTPIVIVATVTPVPPTSTPTMTAMPRVTPTPRAGDTRTFAPDNAPMVFVLAGDFTMGSNDGSNDEKPAHTVYLDSFWIDKFEVTNAQWKKCMEAGTCREPVKSAMWEAYYADPLYGTYPVLDSWEYARKFCEWAGKRLPTEAEWEKAARGVDGRAYPWGNLFDQSKANSGRQQKDTMPVGSFPEGASPYGVMDMAGNVWEWVADWYSENYYTISPRNNPTGPTSGQYHVLRGGSLYSPPDRVRVTYRSLQPYPSLASTDRGFRCAR
jgi:formylglycine-generating enzyme required for sulfatase activity